MSLLKQQLLQERIAMRIELSTIQRICQWDGMANRFHTGFTSSMVWARNLNVKFVVVQAIGAEELSRNISKSGDTLME
jgi:hypothetical protein